MPSAISTTYPATEAFRYANRRKPWLQRGAQRLILHSLRTLGSNHSLRRGLMGMAIVLVSLSIVPWQADEAASVKLAALFNNKHHTLEAAVATPQAISQALLQPEALLPAPQASTALETPPVTPAPPPQTAKTPTTPVVEEKTFALRAGQTIQGLLQAAGTVGEDANAIAKEIKSVFDMRRLKAGQEVTLKVRRDGDITQLLGLTFSAGSAKEIKVARTKTGAFDAKAVNVPTTLKKLVANGEVNSSLYEAASAVGMPRGVMTDVMKIFAHKVDFQRDVHKGDKFHVLYEQNVTAKGDAVGDGQVIFAAIETAGKINRLYRYEFDKGQFDYFDEQGRTAKRGLLRTPVNAARMSSGFGVRRHPILGYSKMHTGVDFAAPTGTPIFAAGDGVVVKAGFNGSYGRYVQIRHNGRLQTAYAHMSRIADKLTPGSRVKQGQVIAYVGTSGRSTGPHLHYEVIIDGRKVNPMSVDVPTGRSLNKTEMANFKRWRERLHAEFQALNKGLPVGAVLAMNTENR